jgi:hypothetical protein
LASIRLPGKATAGRAEQLPAVGWRPGLSMIWCPPSRGGQQGRRVSNPIGVGFGDRPAAKASSPGWPLAFAVHHARGHSGLIGATSERRAVRVGWRCTLARTSPWTAGLRQTVGVTRPRCSTGLCPGAARRRGSASCVPLCTPPVGGVNGFSIVVDDEASLLELPGPVGR